MNALLWVSSVISNSPIILNVDWDMYSNNSQSIRDALCFVMDEQQGHDIAFVQFPQGFENTTKNDLYANALKVINCVDISGRDGLGGTPYIGIGCFHRREALCGAKYSTEYKDDWKRRTKMENEETVSILEDRAKSLSICVYEFNTQWGNEMGLKYGGVVEDLITGLIIKCRGWRSVYFNPERKGFLGVAPTTLLRTLVQHKRWSKGTLQITFSNYCPLFYGHGKLMLGHRMCYCIFGLWINLVMFVIIGTTELINLACLVVGLQRAVADQSLGGLLIQNVVCGLVVALNLPIYEAMFLRKDEGRMKSSTVLASAGLRRLVCVFPAL